MKSDHSVVDAMIMNDKVILPYEMVENLKYIQAKKRIFIIKLAINASSPNIAVFFKKSLSGMGMMPTIDVSHLFESTAIIFTKIELENKEIKRS